MAYPDPSRRGARYPIGSFLRLAMLLFRDNLAARRQSRIATEGNGRDDT